MERKCERCPLNAVSEKKLCASCIVQQAIRQKNSRERKKRNAVEMVPQDRRNELEHERSVRQKRSVEVKTQDKDITKVEQTIVKGDMSVTTKTEKIQSHTVSRIETEIHEYRERYIAKYRLDEAVLKGGTLFKLWKNRVNVEYANGMLEYFCPNASLEEVVQSYREDFEGLKPRQEPEYASMTDAELNDRQEQILKSGSGLFMASAIRESEQLHDRVRSARNYISEYEAERDCSAAGRLAHALELYGLLNGHFPRNLEIVPTDRVHKASRNDDLTIHVPEDTYVTYCQVRDVSNDFMFENVPIRVAVLFGVHSGMQTQWNQWIDHLRLQPLESIPGVPKSLLAGIRMQDMVRAMPTLGSCRLFAEIPDKKLAGYIEDPTSLTMKLSSVLNTGVERKLKDWVAAVQKYMDQGAGAYLTDYERMEVDKRQRCVETIQMICEGPEYRAASLKKDLRAPVSEKDRAKALASLYK